MCSSEREKTGGRGDNRGRRRGGVEDVWTGRGGVEDVLKGRGGVEDVLTGEHDAIAVHQLKG
jgi:hypothetical protein